MEMPVLKTERLTIRPFEMDDIAHIGRVRSVDDMDENRHYVESAIATGEYLAYVVQPPYGDRAVVESASNLLVGIVGLVALLMPFDRLPYRNGGQAVSTPRRNTTEMGLYWEIDPEYRQRGYATEAGQALINYAFHTLNLTRIVANTAYDNAASQGVMRKLGMTLEKNPLPEPDWFQVVGILQNPMEEPYQ
jgi:[ribosomal protein S5]-alanine N-acetyltransferase